jgi:hypothetical protein
MLAPLLRWWAVNPKDPALDAWEESLRRAGIEGMAAVLGAVTQQEFRLVERVAVETFAREGGFEQYPDLWVRERLGEWPWSKQTEVLRALATYRKVAVHSGHGIGKSKLAAWSVAWMLSVFDDAIALTTAPTGAQVRSILWREIRSAHRRGKLAGHTNQVEWIREDGDIIGMGRKPSDTDEHAFQGLHALNALVVLDEAGGIPEGLFEDAEKIVTTPGSRILAVGNPTHEGSYWWKVCAGHVPDWHVIHVSALDTPNFTAEGDYTPSDVLRRVTSELWVDEQRRRYGETSVRYRQQVLGQFTRERAMTVIPVQWAQAAVRPDDERPIVYGIPPRAGVVRLGVDVGATGDWFVIRAMLGNRVGRLWRDGSGSAAKQADLVVTAAREVGAVEVCIDVAGVGYGLPDLIRDRNPGLRVIPVDAAEKSSVVRLADGRSVYRWAVPSGVKPEQVREVFANRRAELWWAGRERSMLAEDPTYHPIVPYVTEPWDLTALEDDRAIGAWLGEGEDDPTMEELTTPGYEHKPRGTGEVILIESKDELRRATRLGRSTDHADALLLAAFPHPEKEPIKMKSASPARRRKPDFQPSAHTYRPIGGRR